MYHSLFLPPSPPFPSPSSFLPNPPSPSSSPSPSLLPPLPSSSLPSLFLRLPFPPPLPPHPSCSSPLLLLNPPPLSSSPPPSVLPSLPSPSFPCSPSQPHVVLLVMDLGIMNAREESIDCQPSLSLTHSFHYTITRHTNPLQDHSTLNQTEKVLVFSSFQTNTL